MPDTIFAPASPMGGALCIVRVSGSDTRAALSRMFSVRDMPPRRVCYGRALNENGETLDACTAVFYASPHSYTGEDMAELTLHGGQAVVRAVLLRLSALGVRPAEPGEFTRRAFLNGKTALTQAEAVMDVINASTARAANAALLQLAGGLQARIQCIEDTLRDTLSALDAAIDYPEEVEEDVTAMLPQTLRTAREALDALAENGMRNRVLRDGARVVIMGLPNVGKSSLMNALLNEERAIVTSIPGTTRDVLQADASFCGVPVRLYDTAGLRESADAVERIGVERAREQAENADLRIFALDASRAMLPEERAMLSSLADKPHLMALCKADLQKKIVMEAAADVIPVSAVTGEGLDALKSSVAALVCPDGEAIVTNARHTALLKRASDALLQAQRATDIDCIATDVREALTALGGVTGNEVDEAVIDGIFEKFCVGK